MEKNQVVKAELVDILGAYDSIYKAYAQKEEEIITDKNKFSRLEALQEVMAEILEKGHEIEKGKEFHYLRRAVRYRMLDKYESEEKHNIFKGIGESDNTSFGILEEMEAEKGYGLTQAYITDILRDIQKTLTVTEYEIWNLYTFQDLTGKQIGEKIGETEVSVCRKLKRIFNKISNLHHACLVDSRYVNALHPKRRSYYKPYTEENGPCLPISRDSYTKPAKTAKKPFKTDVWTIFTKDDEKPYVHTNCVEVNRNREFIYIMNCKAQAMKQGLYY